MDFKKILVRSASGLVYCLVIVGAILCGGDGIIVLASLLSAIACCEFSNISHTLNMRQLPALLLDVAGCILLSLGFLVYPLMVWIAVMVLRMVLELYLNTDRPLRDLSHSMMSQVYIGMPMGLMVLTGYMFDPHILLAVFFFIWINDTGAFLVGSAVGKHRLFERISPKKSWEGFFGGLVFNLGAACLFYYFCNSFFGMQRFDATVWTWLLMATIVTVFGTWGDLVESMIKRSLHIKDSGHWIPGHGGLLDRIDSFLLAMPVVFLFLFIRLCI